MRSLFAWIGVCALYLAIAGCEKKPTSVPGPVTIQIRIVMMFATSDVDQFGYPRIGDPNNLGCRLTLAQIQSYLDQLHLFSSNYGANVEFVVNWPPEWFFFQLVTREFPYTLWVSHLMAHATGYEDPGWDENKINLYFAGRIVNNLANPPEGMLGATLDPSDVVDCQISRHFVLINDRAEEDSLNHAGVVRLDDYVLEHEIGHFLLRQRFGQGGRYDMSEHDWNPDAQHLMKRHAPHCPWLLPFDAAEIKNRVLQNGVTPPCI